MKIGGAMRANYVISDYPRNDSGAASRAGEDGGYIKVADTHYSANDEYRNMLMLCQMAGIGMEQMIHETRNM
jgi:hypothetical protein|tara:strand:- start:6 stop:221 length:216 start_codon:yes stop_codon:yes gene_type:complete